MCYIEIGLFFNISVYLLGFPGGAVGKVASAGDARDAGSIPGVENGNPLQYSCLENSMDGGVWPGLLSMGSQKFGHD